MTPINSVPAGQTTRAAALLHFHFPADSRRKATAYWVATVLIAAEFASGGVIDLLRLPIFGGQELGYPDYFSTIIGVWKILGAGAALAPRFPLLKEWAYAGMFFTMTGAVASLIAVGDGVETLVAPIIFTCLVVASWALRPSSRRLARSLSQAPPARRRAG
ncbi:MAG TPA: DoxX family protein [Actinomycetes bacterium]|nr:DoxX family protein [Actinomycetes bacterium]